MKNKILLTGSPGCGKTTLISKVLSQLSIPASGFYTREIRQRGTRQGFRVVTLDGRRGILAHVNIRGPKRVGKYGVDTDSLDNLAVPAIYQGIKSGCLVVVDEIGPMEIISSLFRQAVLDALDSDVDVFGSIVRRSIPFTDKIKSRLDVTVLVVTPKNRRSLIDHILARFRAEPLNPLE